MQSSNQDTSPLLVHFSAHPLLQEDLYTVSQHHVEPYEVSPIKPQGLWVSVENDPEDGWYAWCQREEYRHTKLRYATQVHLASTSKVLHLSRERDILNFCQTFGTLAEGYVGSGIDWKKVADIYQGILIAPYQWSCRLNRNTVWYYGWTCASGCIWDVSAIAHLTPYNKKKRQSSQKISTLTNIN